MTFSRRDLLRASALGLFTGALGGCTSIQQPAPFLSVTEFPPFYPSFPIPFTADREQLLSIRFIDEVKDGGAPVNIPELRTHLLIQHDSLEVALLAMNFPVWRLYLSVAGLRESRHGLLDRRVAARPFLRDLTFSLWPEKALREMLAQSPDPGQWRLSVTPTSRRLSTRNLLLLDMKTDGRITTLINYPEGYTLTITDADSHQPH